MIKEALSTFPLHSVRLIALLIFFAVFVGMLMWINRRNSSGYYDKASHLPLED